MHQELMERAREVLGRVFGFPDFRANQEDIVRALLAGEDVVAIMPTGAGKSLCYQVPALVRPGTGLVISPLIALMHDQVRALEAAGVRAAALTSAEGAQAQAEARDAFAEGALDLLYVSPERLAMPGFQALLARVPLALVAIDEAHCVSEWGHDFRPEYRAIRPVLDRLAGVPRAAFTATADAATRADICHNLNIPEANMRVAGFDRPNLTYRVTPRTGGSRQIAAEAASRGGQAGIIYCRSRAEVDTLAAALSAGGQTAWPYHAGLDNGVRARNQAAWAAGQGVMVATVAFGMGVDKPDVRYVLHASLPKSIESYMQETGRAGRDGAPADAVMFFGAGDVAKNRSFLDEMEDPRRAGIERARLDALVQLAETPGCRRVPLLKHFGDEPPSHCGACDNCLNPPTTKDATEPARMLLSAVHRTGQRFGLGHLQDVLAGKLTERVSSLGHDGISVFGIGKAYSAGTWQAVARTLVAMDAVRRDPEFGGLTLGPAARAVLRGERSVEIVERSATGKKPPKGGKPDKYGNGAAQDPVFERLRAARKRLASEAGLPPYIIFHDSVLAAIAAARPRTIDALGRVPGVGARKLEAYGDAMLEALDG